MAFLRCSAVATRLEQLGSQEAVVFRNTLGARVGARASVFGADFHRPTLRDLASVVLALAGVGAAAALFFGWLMFSDSGRTANQAVGSQWGCASLGRGGAHCAPRAESGDPLNAGASAVSDCRSMGRAGRVCKAHPANEAM
jgi:hypothetical protein